MKCPICGSDNVRKLHHLEAIDQYWVVCNDCLFKWVVREESLSEIPLVSRVYPTPQPA